MQELFKAALIRYCQTVNWYFRNFLFISESDKYCRTDVSIRSLAVNTLYMGCMYKVWLMAGSVFG